MEHKVTSFRAASSREGFCFKCSVTYFSQSLKLKKNCICMECNATKATALWFCLQCAHLGCGRNHGGHALTHYNITKHMWVMNIATYRIWDYDQMKYLHHNLNDAEIQRIPCFLPTSNACVSNKNNADCLCPVCCHNQKPRLSQLSLCMQCSLSDNLWLCLSCNHIGCGRDGYSHALKHFSSTGHPMAMDMQNFSVWNYNEDKYEHRLVSEDQQAPPLVTIKSEISYDFMDEDYNQRTPEHMENEWNNASLLKETQRLMISVEQRVIELCEEKQQLEDLIMEHDDKLNELIRQFKDLNRNTTISTMNTARTSLPATVKGLENGDANTEKYFLSNWDEENYSLSPLSLPKCVERSQLILNLIFFVFLYNFVYVFLQL